VRADVTRERVEHPHRPNIDPHDLATINARPRALRSLH
jgi:hypothetical protein